MASTSGSVAIDQPRGWCVARVAGVPVHVRGSALAAVVVLWLVVHAQVTPGLAWHAWWVAPTVTTLTSLAFGLSVVLHELAHALVARALRLPVVSVTVFHLGGVTRLGREPEDPREEAMIAAAGPLVNLLLGGVLLAAGVLLGARSITGGVLVFVGYLNGTIGVFNLLPGHPLDGGALVRAASWALTGDAERSLRFSGRLGQGVGGAMVLGGVLGALPGGPVPGDVGWLWLAAIGAFIAVAARAGVVRAGVRVRLAGMRARDLSRASGFEVAGDRPVDEVVGTATRAEGPGLVLDGDGEVIGTFGRRDLERVPPARWRETTVAEAMVPVVGTVGVDDDLIEILPRFRRTRASVLAVLRDGAPVASLSADDVLAHLDRGEPDVVVRAAPGHTRDATAPRGHDTAARAGHDSPVAGES